MNLYNPLEAHESIMQVYSDIPSHEKRHQAGKYALTVPICLQSVYDRIDRSILQVSLDVLNVQFFQCGLPMNPLAGDVVGIFPENSRQHIKIMKENLAHAYTDSFFLSGRHETDEGRYYATEDALKWVSLNPLSIKTLYRLEEILNSLPRIPITMGNSWKILKRLIHLHNTSPQKCQSILKKCHLTDLLCAFPGVLSLQDICDTQGANYRRVFSISGISRDQEGHPTHIELPIALGANYQVPDEGFNPGVEYEGLCSGYIKRLLLASPDDQIDPRAELFIQPRTFGAPEKDRNFIPRMYYEPPVKTFVERLTTPLLLIAAGSGISGIRSILEERKYWKQLGFNPGSSTLLFGLRNQDLDYLYREDLYQYQLEGLIDRIILAESRPNKGRKMYVQHQLMRGSCHTELKEVMQGERVIIICGDGRMGQNVTNGCLPLLLPHLTTAHTVVDFKEKMIDSSKELLCELFSRGKQLVHKLKENNLLIQSTSGSRYPKKEIDFEEVYHSLVEAY